MTVSKSLKATAAMLALVAACGGARAQFLAEQQATMGGMDALNSGGVAPAGGQLALDRAQVVAYPNPVNPGLAGLGGPAVGQPGIAGQPGQTATPTPIPQIQVLTGKRVFDAVTGALLEDAFRLTVPITDRDRYFDDGVRDNGIPNDGIRGDVETIRDRLIGAETAAAMFQNINLVRNAERMSTLEFFRLHVGVTDPAFANDRMPDLIQMERKKDDLLRDWNNRFLAQYRTDKNNPKSDFFQVYVPEPPAIPAYPIPPGYQSPQRVAIGETPGPNAGQPTQPQRTPNILNGESHFGSWTQAQPKADGDNR
jgi:hypothetical protein